MQIFSNTYIHTVLQDPQLAESAHTEAWMWRTGYGTRASADFGVCGGSWHKCPADTERQLYYYKEVFLGTGTCTRLRKKIVKKYHFVT